MRHAGIVIGVRTVFKKSEPVKKFHACGSTEIFGLVCKGGVR